MLPIYFGDPPLRFPRKVKRAMEANNYSIQQVADAVQVSSETVEQWLRGVVFPSSDSRKGLCTLFGCKESDLFADYEKDCFR